jgi:hypothetical protein
MGGSGRVPGHPLVVLPDVQQVYVLADVTGVDDGNGRATEHEN